MADLTDTQKRFVVEMLRRAMIGSNQAIETVRNGLNEAAHKAGYKNSCTKPKEQEE